ncbi:hypothetical protein A3B32_03465 [Candidatus Uhrbacteria bacterium RIFCSPLOWO2_01_FULL_53_9]|uniref:Methyltransferase type 11 domain-containing protein n=1 Tax=Candidatus Uhrbacteria bacterium RIFCSPLOWO2_01_FULL_53_9 TaxID=1802403 RepID=A0A1F7V035_9BACT|nr:MAG: hypothetical protein A3B32_03465 [Candidatus Uhrbacteria bacterium RIFCSPLOWO2_01_FULL_53_9]
MNLPTVQPDLQLHTATVAATERYTKTWHTLSDSSYWPLKMFVALHLWLWHLDAFKKDEDPVPLFVQAFDRATALLEFARDSGVCGGQFPPHNDLALNEHNFESRVSGLFCDAWVQMTDDIYFDEAYAFTKERFEKSGVNLEEFFGGKTVLDAGCGSGKFSAALAKFGAAKVIGLDIGEKGLAFAREQAKKVSYGDRLEYRCGSLLDIPLPDASVDMVWSNGVIHHTLGYEQCIAEFSRVLKPGGRLFLYVNGRFGLLELLQDTLRKTNVEIPRELFLHYVMSLGNNSGRVYWLMDCLYSPYEWKSKAEVVALLEKHGFADIKQLIRGVSIDQIEQVTMGLPYAEIKYGEAQLKFLAMRI